MNFCSICELNNDLSFVEIRNFASCFKLGVLISIDFFIFKLLFFLLLENNFFELLVFSILLLKRRNLLLLLKGIVSFEKDKFNSFFSFFSSFSSFNLI